MPDKWNTVEQTILCRKYSAKYGIILLDPEAKHMIFLAVDDEVLALEALVRTVKEAVPGAQVMGFQRPAEALQFAKENACSIAFLDIRMRGMTGLELARRLKEVDNTINIVFVTGYCEYSMDAFRLHASDYLLKPIDINQVKTALAHLRNPVELPPQKRVQIKCFGNFEVTVEGEPLVFTRKKTKELLAYLTDRMGASCSMGELTAVLWEDKPDSLSQRSNLRNLISDLKNALSKAGAEDVILKQRNSISLNPDAVDCDYYDFLRCDPMAVNRYRGEYMLQYSWAEMTTGSLPPQLCEKE